MSTRPERTDRVTQPVLLKTLIVGMVAMVGLAGCSDPGASATDFPGTEEGAKALLTKLLENEADRAMMTLALKPTDADYEAIFVSDVVDKVKKGYESLWSGNPVIKPKEGQTALLLWGATSAEIKDWTGGAARDFPGGWKGVGASLQDGLTFYRFKFVEPGETLGMAFDGLVYVNDHWVWAPKPGPP